MDEDFSGIGNAEGDTGVLELPHSTIGAPPRGEAAQAVKDIDVHDWLGRDDSSITGYAVVRAGRIKIAALTEEEIDGILSAARTRQPGKPATINSEKAKLLTIAYSINKANGKVLPGGAFAQDGINPNALKKKLSGELTELYKAISELSGFRDSASGQEDARVFFD